MCRLLSWIGSSRYLDEFVLKADQSLVMQSRAALIGHTTVNADGFGLAWYSEHDTPCIYKDIHPAWSDANLEQIAAHTKAEVFLAHVRSSTLTATSRNNCHPFSWGRWSFMHNGQVGGHLNLRHALDAMIPVECYNQRNGATDSEAIFLIAVGLGLDHAPIAAMEQAVGQVEMLSRHKGCEPHMRFASCWSDGKRIFAARYASDVHAPSLYYKIFDNGIVISSEPLNNDLEHWNEIMPGTAVIADGLSVTVLPFAPQQPFEEIRRT